MRKPPSPKGGGLLRLTYPHFPQRLQPLQLSFIPHF